MDGTQVVELEDVENPGVQQALPEKPPEQPAADLLTSLQDPALESRLRKGFEVLGWNEAKQLTHLLQFSGREDELLAVMLGEANG